MTEHKWPKKYFVVAVDTNDEQEAIQKAWTLGARFVWDAEFGQLATIVTDKHGSRLMTRTKRATEEG